MITIGPFDIPYIPSFAWFIIAATIVIALWIFVANKSHTLWLLFGQMYESMEDFFADILGESEKRRVKSFVTNIFFVVLFYNLLGLLTDFVAPIFGYETWLGVFSLSKYLGFATSDYHFTIAMAAVGVLVTLFIQFMSMDTRTVLWGAVKTNKSFTWAVRVFNFIYDYLPFWWKGIITIDKGDMSPAIYYPLRVVVKLFDIVISMFVGFLDIIWVGAKVISLAFRLFGNMLSGTALLTVLVVSLNAATQWWIGFEFPILAPILLFVQWLLVACIQAFVFPLLIAIFIKVARMWTEDETQPATT